MQSSRWNEKLQQVPSFDVDCLEPTSRHGCFWNTFEVVFGVFFNTTKKMFFFFFGGGGAAAGVFLLKCLW